MLFCNVSPGVALLESMGVFFYVSPGVALLESMGVFLMCHLVLLC